MVNIQERARGPKLVGRDHEVEGSGEILIEYAYTIQIVVSSINLDANYIIAKFVPFETIEAGDLYRTLCRRVRKHHRQAPKWLALNKLHDKRCLMHVF